MEPASNLNSLSAADWLTRYILSRNHYSPENQTVKYGAFLPRHNSESSVWEVSVFRITHLPDKEIWLIGEREVAQKSRRTLRARADLSVSNVQTKKLTVALDNNPPEHANITGWPVEQSEQKLIAIELAANSILHVK